MQRRLPLWLKLCLVATLAGAWLYAGINVAAWFNLRFFSSQRADVAFRIEYSDRISFAAPQLQRTGGRAGDRVLAIGGEPFTGLAQEFQQVRRMHRGDLYPIQLQKSDGSIVTVRPALPPLYAPTSTHRWRSLAFGFALNLLFPLVCLALGTWVLVARPADLNAWYVFVILHYPVSFYSSPEQFAGLPLAFMPYWNDLVQSTFLIAALLFALSFPDRFGWDRRAPWLRRTVAAVYLLSLPVDFTELAMRYYHAEASSPRLDGFFRATDHVESICGTVFISFFCGALFSKYFRARNPDAKRRLRVLVAGSQIGLWPVFLLVVRAHFMGTDFGQATPIWIVITALVLFMAFPLSLAYAIIVQRAMDLRILLRQGTQYALARGSLIAMRLIASCLLAFTVYEILGRHRHGEQGLALAVVALALLVLLRFGLEKNARQWIDRKFFRESYASEQVLSELVTQTGGFTETGPLLDTVSRRIADTLHVENVVMLMRSGNGFRLQTAMGVDVPNSFLLGAASESVHALERRRGPATVYFDRPDEWLMDASDAERAALRELNVEVLLPLPGRHRLMGVMALGPKRSEQPYSKADLQLLTSVGTQTGLALENSELLANLTTEVAQRERMNRELEIAHEVQERLFPQIFPHLPGVQVMGSCRPAQGVGGDYYDCMVTGGGRLALAIGDVSGKGVSAALLMASLRASLRGQTMQGNSNLAQIVTNVNALLFDSSASNRYATFFFAEFDPATRKICYVNAGHNPPALLRKTSSGIFERHWLNGGGGPVIGLMAGSRYEQCELQMQSGDLLLLYTDGISEAMDLSDDEWGEERMVAETERLWPLSAQEILNGLVNAADRFASGAEQHDDMTLMVMKLE